MGKKKRRGMERGGENERSLPKDILVKNPYFAFLTFFSDEQQFSLTKHFLAYLQTEGGDGAQVGT